MVALTRASFTNSIRNIRAIWNNNVFQYSPDSGVTQKQIIIPDGYYQLKDIDAYIRARIAANGDDLPGDIPPIRLLLDRSTIRVVITVAANYQVTWIAGGLCELLGFDPGVIDGTVTPAFSADHNPDINRGTNTLYILCDLVVGTYLNGVEDQVLYSCTLKGAPGAIIDVAPTTPEYCPIGRQGETTIPSINIRIVDELSRPVDFDKFPVDLRLHFKSVDLANEL